MAISKIRVFHSNSKKEKQTMTYYCNYYFNSKFKCKKDEELTESTTDIPNVENDEEDRKGYKTILQIM